MTIKAAAAIDTASALAPKLAAQAAGVVGSLTERITRIKFISMPRQGYSTSIALASSVGCCSRSPIVTIRWSQHLAPARARSRAIITPYHRAGAFD
jgi:hypothetical protein